MLPIISSTVFSLSLNQGINRPLELLFIVDASQEVSKNELQKMKDFIDKQLKIYDVSPVGTRMSVISYGDKSKIVLSLRDGISNAAVRSALNQLEKLGGQRRLDLALRTSKNVMSPQGGLRPQAGKLAVIFIAVADSSANPAQLSKDVKALRDVGVKLTVVGIGSDVKDNEMEAVVIDPESIMKLPTANDLSEATPLVSQGAGDATGKVLYFFSCDLPGE